MGGDKGGDMRLYGGVRYMDRVSPANVRRLDHLAMPMIHKFHTYGIRVDLPFLRSLEKEINIRQLDLESSIFSSIGNVYQDFDGKKHQPLNIGSPDQVARLLFKHLQVQGRDKIQFTSSEKRETTSDDVLELYRDKHPAVGLILDWREGNKIQGTYVRPLQRWADSESRIHTSFSTTTAATGRLASRWPNLQNIPVRTELGKRIRRAFLAGIGRVLVSNDLSQIEMRWAAHLAQDPTMMAVFWNDEDIHDRTACEIFSRSLAEITALKKKVKAQKATSAEEAIYKYFVQFERLPSKTLGFGILYGQTEQGLRDSIMLSKDPNWTMEERQAFELKWSIERCKELIDQWYGVYSKIKAWMELQFSRVKRFGLNWDAFGRMRLVPEIYSTHKRIRAEGLRKAGNHPIQCLPASTKILTTRGYERIGDFKDGVVWTGGSWANARRIRKGGGWIVQVHVDDGAIVRCDTSHNFLVYRSAYPEWVNVMDLQAGDALASWMHDKSRDDGEKLLTPKFWYWVGRYYGDGSFYNKKDEGWSWRKYVTWTFGGVKMSEVNRCVEDLRELGYNPKIEHFTKISKYSGKKLYTCRVIDRMFDKTMLEVGITPNLIHCTKRLAKTIFTLDAERRRAVIQGYYDADGTRRLEGSLTQITSVNVDLLRDTQLLLRSLGESSKLLGPYRQKVEGHREFYRLTFYSPNEFRRVAAVVGEESYEKVYTLSVDDERHAFDTEGLISKNSSAQGTIKLAMAELDPISDTFNMAPGVCWPLLQIHDELITEVDRGQAKDWGDQASEVMEHATPLSIPVKSSSDVAERWSDLK